MQGHVPLDAGFDGRLYPGPGNDVLKDSVGESFVFFGSAVPVDLAAGTATGEGNDTLQGIAKVVGSPYAVAPGTLRTRTGSPFRVFTPFARAWAAHGWDHPIGVPDVRWLDGLDADPIAFCGTSPAPFPPGDVHVTTYAVVVEGDDLTVPEAAQAWSRTPLTVRVDRGGEPPTGP